MTRRTELIAPSYSLGAFIQSMAVD